MNVGLQFTMRCPVSYRGKIKVIYWYTANIFWIVLNVSVNKRMERKHQCNDGSEKQQTNGRVNGEDRVGKDTAHGTTNFDSSN